MDKMIRGRHSPLVVASVVVIFSAILSWTGGLFVTMSLLAGLVLKMFFMEYIPVPYTVVMLIVGFLAGVLAYILDQDGENIWYCQSVYVWISLDPHTLLYTFLPALIFASAHRVEYQTFVREMPQILTYATIGVAMSVLIIGWSTYGIFGQGFGYGWDISTSCCLGAIVSATDPVAVVALLHELGAPHRLSILIEGESLFNDGTALVVYFIFFDLMKSAPEDRGFSVDQVVLFIRLAFGGVVLGYFSGIALEYALHRTKSAVEEITTTLAFAYAVFLLGEGVLEVSGVLAVVLMGIMYSYSAKTRVEHPEALEAFWDLMDFIANSILFAVAGATISSVVVDNEIGIADVGLTLLLYVLLMFVRTFVIFSLLPFVQRCGYHAKGCCGFFKKKSDLNQGRETIVLRTKKVHEEGARRRTVDELKRNKCEWEWELHSGRSSQDVRSRGVTWKESLVLAFGGLRGAVGLALATMVVEESYLNDNIDQKQAALILFHVACFTTLTLIVNGTQTGRLVSFLSLTRMTESNRRLFQDAVNILEKLTLEKISEYQKEAVEKNAESPLHFVSWEKVYGLMPAYTIEMLMRRYNNTIEKGRKGVPNVLNPRGFIPIRQHDLEEMKDCGPMRKVAARYGQERKLSDLAVEHPNLLTMRGMHTHGASVTKGTFRKLKERSHDASLASIHGISDHVLSSGEVHTPKHLPKYDKDVSLANCAATKVEANETASKRKSRRKSLASFHVAIEAEDSNIGSGSSTTKKVVTTPGSGSHALNDDDENTLCALSDIVHNYRDPIFFSEQNMINFLSHYGPNVTEMRIRFLQMLKAQYDEMHQAGNLSPNATKVLGIQADKAIDAVFEGSRINDWMTPSPSMHALVAKRLAQRLTCIPFFDRMSDTYFFEDAVKSANIIFKYIEAHEDALKKWTASQAALHRKLAAVKYVPKKALDRDLNVWQPAIMEIVKYDVEQCLSQARVAKRRFSADEVAENVITNSVIELLLKQAIHHAHKLHHRGMLDHSEVELVEEMIEFNRERLAHISDVVHKTDKDFLSSALKKTLASFGDSLAAIGEDDWEKICSYIAKNCLVKRTFEPHDVIYHQGDPEKSFFLIALGAVRQRHRPDWYDHTKNRTLTLVRRLSTSAELSAPSGGIFKSIHTFVSSAFGGGAGKDDADEETGGVTAKTANGSPLASKVEEEGKIRKTSIETPRTPNFVESSKTELKRFDAGDVVRVKKDAENKNAGDLYEVESFRGDVVSLRSRRDGSKGKSLISSKAVSMVLPVLSKKGSDERRAHHVHVVKKEDMVNAHNLLNVFTALECLTSVKATDKAVYNIGDVCKVTKVGSHEGELCTVKDPHFSAKRILVVMMKDGSNKSYEAAEICFVRDGKGRNRKDLKKRKSSEAANQIMVLDTVRVTKKSDRNAYGVVIRVDAAGRDVDVRLYSGETKTFGNWDLEVVSEVQNNIESAEFQRNIHDAMLSAQSQSGGDDKYGFNVVDRSVGGVLGDCGIFSEDARYECTAIALSSVIAFEIDHSTWGAHMEKLKKILLDEHMNGSDSDESSDDEHDAKASSSSLELQIMARLGDVGKKRKRKRAALPSSWIADTFSNTFERARTRSAALVAIRLYIPQAAGLSISIDRCLQKSSAEVQIGKKGSNLKTEVNSLLIIVSGSVVHVDDPGKHLHVYDLQIFIAPEALPAIPIEIKPVDDEPVRVVRIDRVPRGLEH
eukprot:g1496.t1